MLLIVCPYCGKRPEIEFTNGGQAHLVRPAQPAELDDQQWGEFLYMRSNLKGIYAERWRHARGCGRFFNAVRDTTTDHFLATYKSGQPQPKFDTPQSASAPPGASAPPSSSTPPLSSPAPGSSTPKRGTP